MKLLLSSATFISIVAMIRGGDVIISILLEFFSSIKFLFSSSLYMCIIITTMVALIAASSSFPRPVAQARLHPTSESYLEDRKGSPEISPQPPELPGRYPLYEVSDHEDNDSPHVLQEMEKRAYSDETGLSETAENFLKEEENDTMEATWKAIMGGGEKDKRNKELKKSITWSNNHVSPPSSSGMKGRIELRKSETFNDAVLIARRGGLRRDVPVVQLKDFNEEVEAFIKKFNENMRLQRQESNQRFLDMINRGI